MTPWAHLPNAALIDEVLASAGADPEKWRAARAAAWDAARDAAWSAAQGAAWDTAWVAAWDAAQDAARDAARAAAWDAARDAAWSAAQGAAWNAAWGAVAALIAYDDAGQFMKLPTDHLQRLYRIDPHPMFFLLQPAAIVFTEQGDPVCPG